MPPGFPKGQLRFTTAKVIVARAFAPKTGATAPSVRLAFSDDDSSHGTHVAGIAAGNADTPADGRRISGVAPRAYLGNYKVFVETDDGLSPNANSPAIVAAIEAAVADCMDVINFSGGEPEIEPSRDIVALALDAAAAGVVPVIAANNDYGDFGAGWCPPCQLSEGAIAVGAVEITGTKRKHADFSSVGRRRSRSVSSRTSQRLKVDVLSSVSGGGWAAFSGTSMASPHVAGAAALLRHRHPAWTVEQLKSALVQSGVDSVDERGRTAGPRFQGGGVIALQRADRPLLFARPTALSFGLMARGQDATQTVGLEDAGGGAGTWNVARVVFNAPAAGPCADASTDRDGAGRAQRLCLRRTRLAARDLDAYVELRRGADVRRVPVWARVTAAGLARHKTLALGSLGSTAAARSGKVVRDALPISGGPERRRRHDDAPRARARLPPPTDEARGELRRRDHPPWARQPRRAEGRRGSRREPADRVRRASDQSQPVHGRVRRADARGRSALASPGGVRSCLRQRGASRCGILPLPLLGQ
jgi:hypothetical protein